MFWAPEASTMASWVARASNLLGAVLKAECVRVEISAAMASAKPAKVFMPVPTAVPPCARSLRCGSVSWMRSIPRSSCAT